MSKYAKPYDERYDMKGVQLCVSPEILISAHPDDLALASRIAGARGETQAEVLGAALRKLLSQLLPTSEAFNTARRDLDCAQESFERADIYPRARPGISHAEKVFIRAVCQAHGVTVLAFVRTALRRYHEELVRSGLTMM